MSDETTTAKGRQPAPLVGQGVLSLPGIGEIWLVWSELGLVVLGLPGHTPDAIEANLMELGLTPPPRRALPAAYAEPLTAYAAGEGVEPAELPVDLRGTAFQQRVWQALRRVPRGSVRSYKGIALDIGAPRAMRAVGQANHVNPLAIVVPCHRIVESGGGLGGYGGGLSLKRHLLALEGVTVKAGNVSPGQLELDLGD